MKYIINSKGYRKIGFILLFAVLTVQIPFYQVNAAKKIIVASGNCGDDATYILTEDAEDEYTLTIDGTGAISDYYNSSYGYEFLEKVPWWEYRKKIKRIIVNKGITRIGASNFMGLGGWGVKDIELPETLKEIGDYAFYAGINQEQFIVPEGVEKIGKWAFACSGNEWLENTTGISNGYIKSVILPSTLKYLGEEAFRECAKLEDITFLGDTEISSCAFYGCKSLYEVNMNADVTRNKDAGYEFYGCTSLRNIRLSDTYSWENAKIYGPYDSFENGALRNITVDESHQCYKSIDGILYTKNQKELVYCPQKNEITEYEIPNGTEKIRSDAFCGQESLEYVCMPDTITEIGYGAFLTTSLKYAVISNAVTSIPGHVFANNAALSVYVPSSVTDTTYNGKTSGDSFGKGLDEPYLLSLYGDDGSYIAQNYSSVFKKATYADFIVDGKVIKRKVLFPNCKYGILPEVESDGKRFIGWYTKETDGELISPLDLFTGEKSIKLYAHWAETCFSGKDGDLEWSIDPDGVLTISGEGDYNDAEWCNYSSYIKEAVVNVNGITSTSHMFQGCSDLESLNLSNLDTRNVEDMSHMFDRCTNLISLDLSGFVTEKVTNMGWMFFGCQHLTSLDLSSFNTENVKYMDCMFFKCIRLIDLDLSSFNTENVEYMDSIFQDCRSLTNLNLSGLNTKNIRNMEFIFDGCRSLIDLDLSSFNTEYAGSMKGMFSGCKSLKSLDLSNINTENVNDMSYMFFGCSGLTDIDLGNFNTEKVAHMNNMFSGCSNLKSLDLGDFDTKNIVNMDEMLLDCSSLSFIKISADWKCTVELPKADGSFWKNSNDKICTEIASGLTQSMVYRRETGTNKNIAQCDISLEKTSYIYDGTEKEPLVTIQNGNSVLESGKDYRITYSDNINAGKALVHIIGLGSYQGEIYKIFTIVPKPIGSAVVTLENYTYTYDGTAKKPAVTVKDGEVTLSSGEDYEIGYSDNVSAGTAKVTVTGKGNYSGTATKTFTIIPSVTPIEPLKSFTWNRDNWNFINTYSDFPSGKYINHINSTYLEKLKDNLTNTEYYDIFNRERGIMYKNWGGSCYGMSTTSLLSMLNYLPYSEYKSGAENLNQLDSPVQNSNISSLITYYQVLQKKTKVQQQMIRTLYKTKEENINKILSLLDTNPTVLVCFQKAGWGGHAILAYEYEYGNYTWDNVSYDGCIKICDPNSSKRYRDDFNIYFNTETFDWVIPFYSNAPITSRAGAQFSYVGADIDEINAGGYLGDGQVKNLALDYVARIDINTNAEAKDYSVAKVEKSNEEYVEKDGGSDDIKERYSYILAGESEGTAGFDLFDSDSAYKVTQNGEKEMALSIDYGDCYLESTVSEGESIIFDKNGYVEMSGDAGDFNISMTFNEDYPTKWSSVEVSGSGSEEITVEKGDEGYIISGDTLKNVDIELEHRDESIQTRFSTEYDTACICEIDEDTVGVKVDTDGNGTYDTVIKTSDEKEDLVSTSSPVPSKPAVPFQPPVIIPSSSPSAVPTISPATEVPQNTATPEPTKTPEVTVSPEPVETPTPTSTPTVQPDNSLDTDNEDDNSGKALKKGAKVTDKKTQAIYRVTGTGKNRTVEYVRSTKKNAYKVTIPAKVKLKGHNYKVVSIAPNAFKYNTKLSYITIGKNVKKIGKKAYYGCKKLRYIYVKSKKLMAKSIGKQAFGGGYKLPRVKSAKNVWKRYARILLAKGLSKKAVFIINPVKLIQ